MRILAFLDKGIGRQLALDMLQAFPDDEYVFILGAQERSETEMALGGHDVRRLSEDTVSSLRKDERPFDWLLNLWGRYIFRADDLALARDTLNVHPAWLPRARGSDALVWTIRHGFECRATLHRLAREVDTGDIWAESTVPYTLPITGGALHARAVQASVDLFKAQWANIRSGAVSASPQSGPARTYWRRELEPDRRIECDDTILRLLAHDFNDGYRAIISFEGREYHAHLELALIKPK